MDIINGEYPLGVFLRGLKFSGKKIRDLIFLGENLRGLKSISKFDQNFFKISSFLKITDPNISKIVTISLIFEWNKGCQIYMEKRGLKIYSEKIRGLSEENTPGGYSPSKMSAPLFQSLIKNKKSRPGMLFWGDECLVQTADTVCQSLRPSIFCRSSTPQT